MILKQIGEYSKACLQAFTWERCTFQPLMGFSGKICMPCHLMNVSSYKLIVILRRQYRVILAASWEWKYILIHISRSNHSKGKYNCKQISSRLIEISIIFTCETYPCTCNSDSCTQFCRGYLKFPTISWHLMPKMSELNQKNRYKTDMESSRLEDLVYQVMKYQTFKGWKSETTNTITAFIGVSLVSKIIGGSRYGALIHYSNYINHSRISQCDPLLLVA